MQSDPSEDMKALISANLTALRKAAGMSLDALAKASDVSKSMLGQIERGEVNPTISTVWKIANGLKVPFTVLLERRRNSAEVVDHNEAALLTEDDGRFRNYTLFPYESRRRFEVYLLELDVGASLDAQPHPPGTEEFLTAFSGELTVYTDGHEYAVPDGSAIRFPADRPHSYRSTGDAICRLSMVIYYPV